MERAWFASRYDRGTPDYINCPMEEEEYQAFWEALTTAQEAEVHGFEDSGVFEGCMPVEVMARRGQDTLCYGPLKPVGLKDPRTGREPFAVVQLRRDNAQGSIYNIVGFQTHLKWPEQKRVFSMIPGLERAEFVRYGVMHRNTYLDSPACWTGTTGCGGRSGSCSRDRSPAWRDMWSPPPPARWRLWSWPGGWREGAHQFPRETAMGAMALYISDQSVVNFQPMNVNFGLIPPLGYRVKGKRNKNAELSKRALEALGELELS